MTDAGRDVIPTLPDDVAVVNVGLAMFGDAVAAQGLAGMTGMVGQAANRLAVAAVPAGPVPRLAGMAAAGGSTSSSDSGGKGRSLVHIENYHPPDDASAADVAHDLDWFSRGGG